ncbi:MAG TPA: hypothetical protein PLF40_11155 [Kofleriaceae bacterium]|nr:hypothetical protein [Kofleriaceae bacterium]
MVQKARKTTPKIAPKATRKIAPKAKAKGPRNSAGKAMLKVAPKTARKAIAPEITRKTATSAHPFWGSVSMTRLGTKPSKTFKLRGLNAKLDVYLGTDDDDDEPLTTKDLDAAAVVFASFLANADDHVVAIRTAAFERYLRLYARYYEDAAARQPLGIKDAAQHFPHLGDKAQVRVDKRDVTVSFWYQLDREHGLEFRFRKDKLIAVGGFSDT